MKDIIKAIKLFIACKVIKRNMRKIDEYDFRISKLKVKMDYEEVCKQKLIEKSLKICKEYKL